MLQVVLLLFVAVSNHHEFRHLHVFSVILHYLHIFLYIGVNGPNYNVLSVRCGKQTFDHVLQGDALILNQLEDLVDLDRDREPFFLLLHFTCTEDQSLALFIIRDLQIGDF